MKIELKRITYNKRLSQETSAYAADVWVNGVKRGTVENSGHGGPDNIFPHTLAHEIDEYAKTLPEIPFYGDKTMAQSAEIIFGELLNAHLYSQDLKKAMKGKILFTTSDGKMYTVKGTVVPKDAVKVLNHMPFDEALVLFRKSNSP